MKYAILALTLLAGSAWADIPEEPPLIEADLTLTDGSRLFCLFIGEVVIDGASGEVAITGCPVGVIACDTLEVAEINTFAPFVAASGCAFGQVHSDGFELKR